MDTRGLDLLSGQVLLHKLLALESVPQSALPGVPVSSDDYFHFKKKEIPGETRQDGLCGRWPERVHRLLLYWTPLANRLCRLWFID